MISYPAANFEHGWADRFAWSLQIRAVVRVDRVALPAVLLEVFLPLFHGPRRQGKIVGNVAQIVHPVLVLHQRSKRGRLVVTRSSPIYLLLVLLVVAVESEPKVHPRSTCSTVVPEESSHLLINIKAIKSGREQHVFSPPIVARVDFSAEVVRILVRTAVRRGRPPTPNKIYFYHILLVPRRAAPSESWYSLLPWLYSCCINIKIEVDGTKIIDVDVRTTSS